MLNVPTLTPKPPVNTTKRQGHHSEPTIVINPKNPKNLVAGCNNNTPEGTMYVMVSHDSGQTWLTRQIGTGPNRDGLPFSFCDPSIAFDRFGNCYYVYLTITSEVVAVRSQNGGNTFGDPVKVSGSDCDQPTITTGPGTMASKSSIWVTYRDSNGSIVAVGAESSGLGKVGVFGSPFSVPGSAGGNFGDIAVGPKGQVMVTYQSPANGDGPSTIYVNTKPDGTGPGAFGSAVKVSDTNVGGFDQIPAQNNRSIDAEAGLAWDCSNGAHKGRVYLVYTDEIPNESNNTDICLRYSDDNGATWSARKRISDDTKKRSQFLPRLALDQTTGNLGIIFYDARRDNGKIGPGSTNTIPNDDVHVFATAGKDGGTTFAKNIQITAGVSNAAKTGNGNELADYIGLAFHKGVMHGVWTDNSNSTGDNPDGPLSGGDIYTAQVVVS